MDAVLQKYSWPFDFLFNFIAPTFASREVPFRLKLWSTFYTLLFTEQIRNVKFSKLWLLEILGTSEIGQFAHLEGSTPNVEPNRFFKNLIMWASYTRTQILLKSNERISYQLICVLQSTKQSLASTFGLRQVRCGSNKYRFPSKKSWYVYSFKKVYSSSF